MFLDVRPTTLNGCCNRLRFCGTQRFTNCDFQTKYAYAW